MFRLTYPLAFLGAHLAFMPLLLLLLPRRVERITPDDATTWLSLLLIAGAATASVTHIAAGWWSDRRMARVGSRRLPIAIGLVLLAASYAAMGAAETIPSLALGVIGFQVALNIMFAPLGALLADYVDDSAKGLTAALLALALPLSMAVIGPVASAFPTDTSGAFTLLMVAIVACVLPLLFLWPASAAAGAVDAGGGEAMLARTDFLRAWVARFLVQCGAAFIVYYLYVYVRQLPAIGGGEAQAAKAVAALATVGGVAGAIAALGLGRLSDRLQRRRWPVLASGVTAAAGLLLLTVQPAWPLIIAGYALFSGGLTAFLALDSALVAQMLGGHPERGRWLGIMNLTNTLPAIVTPLLTLLALQFATEDALRYLLSAAAIANLLAGRLILGITSSR